MNKDIEEIEQTYNGLRDDDPLQLLSNTSSALTEDQVQDIIDCIDGLG